MDGEFTLDFNSIDPCLRNMLGMMALSDLTTDEYHEATQLINRLLEIWNKKERGAYTGD